MTNPQIKRALDHLDQKLNEDETPAVTDEQLQRIMHITETDDPEEQTRRYNAVYSDLMQQAEQAMISSIGEFDRSVHNGAADVSGSEELIAAANEQAIEQAKAEAAELMRKYRLPSHTPRSAPRTRRVAI